MVVSSSEQAGMIITYPQDRFSRDVPHIIGHIRPVDILIQTCVHIRNVNIPRLRKGCQ